MNQADVDRMTELGHMVLSEMKGDPAELALEGFSIRGRGAVLLNCGRIIGRSSTPLLDYLLPPEIARFGDEDFLSRVECHDPLRSMFVMFGVPVLEGSIERFYVLEALEVDVEDVFAPRIS